MKNILLVTTLALSIGSTASVAQEITGLALKPANLNDLGASIGQQMKDTVSEDLKGFTGDKPGENQEVSTAEKLSLFDGSLDEDPFILEIKKIARELEDQRALMIQVSDLQSDLIDFAMTDAAAAHQSRIPSAICKYALEARFCDAMTSSFQKRDIIVNEN